MNRILSAMSLFALLCLAGCGANVAGSWNGTWTGDNNTGAGGMNLVLSQSGSGVNGEAVLTGLGCLSDGTLSGSMSGDKLGATIESGSVMLTLTGTVSDDDKSVGGTYSFDGGLCSGQTGTWKVSKQ